MQEKFHQYQSQIYLARAGFVTKMQSEALLESEVLIVHVMADRRSSMSSSETWNKLVCCTVVIHVVIHSRFVVQPQKSDGDQMKCQCEELLAGP